MPKSIESYYQETGRAGRDNGEGHCLAFYAYKDIEKLEKFMSGKPVAEQEIGFSLLNDMVAFAETSISRRKFILHYFGEHFDSENGEGADMDDNVRFPKPQREASKELKILIQLVLDTKQKYKSKEIVKTLTGAKNALILSHKTHEKTFFGVGKEKDSKFWMALLRQALIGGYFTKEIETYGIIRVTEKAKLFLKNPDSFLFTADHDYESRESNFIVNKSQTSTDTVLMELLRSLRTVSYTHLTLPTKRIV